MITATHFFYGRPSGHPVWGQHSLPFCDRPGHPYSHPSRYGVSQVSTARWYRVVGVSAAFSRSRAWPTSVACCGPSPRGSA